MDDALAYIRERDGEGRGGIYFLVGAPETGGGRVLDGLYAALRAQGGKRRVVRASLSSGDFEVAAQHASRSIVDRSEDAAKVIQHLAATFLLPPPAQQLVQNVIEGSAAAMRLAIDGMARRGAMSGSIITQLLAEATKEHVLILLVDGLDSQGAAWFSQLLEDEWADDVGTDLRAVFVTTLDGPRSLPSSELGLPPALRVAARLSRIGQARWHSLGPIESKTVRAWLGPSPESLTRHLWEASGGIPSLVESIWGEWNNHRVVVVGADDQPRFVADADIRGARGLRSAAVERIRSVAPTSADAVVDVLLALKIGSLQGEVFTADAVADVLQLANRDLLVDAFDGRLTTDDPTTAILEEVGHHTVTLVDRPPQHLCRYRFRSTAIWMGLRTRGLAPDQRVEYARKLAGALKERYGDHADSVASSLAVLHALAGNPGESARWQRIHEEGADADVLRWRAHLILAADSTEWTLEQCEHGVGLLYRAFEGLAGLVSIDEIHQYATVALVLASQTESPKAVAKASWMMGVVCNKSGNAAKAVQYGRAAVEAWKAVPNPVRAAASALELASHLMWLQRDVPPKQREALRDEMMQALEFARNEGEGGTAGNALIQMSLFSEDPARIRELLREALDVLPDNGSGPFGRARVWDRLAMLEMLDGEFTRAIDLLSRAQKEAEAHKIHHMLWAVLVQRGAVEVAAGRFEAAQGWFDESYTRATSLGHHGMAFKSMLGTSLAHAFLGHSRSAGDALARARALATPGPDAQTVNEWRKALVGVADARTAGTVGPAFAANARSVQRQLGTALTLLR